MANPWDNDPIVQPGNAGPIVTPLPMSPKDRAREGRDNAAASRDDLRTGIAVRGEERDIGYKTFDQASKLRDDYNQNTQIKAFEASVPMYVTALKTSPDRAGDLLFVTAFAKMSDPTTGVLGGEREGVATGSQSYIENKQAELRSLMDQEGGNFSAETRKKLRFELNNLMAARGRAYIAQRQRYAEDAKAAGIDPARVIGPNVGDTEREFVQNFWKENQQPESGGDIYTVAGPNGKKIEFTVPPGASDDEIRELGIAATKNPRLKGSPVNRPPDDYRESYMGQGMSGVNEGMASVLGGPVDLATAAMNLVPKGINALANTNIPEIENPMFGSQSIKGMMGDSLIYGQSADPSKQFARRIGESVGAAAVPAGFAGSLPKMGATMLAGAGGGVGAATAQQAFPGNPLAEMGGEVLGGGLTGAGLLGSANRNARRQIEAAVPTSPQLREQAGDLYRQAEARGVTADPMMTQNLADNMRDVLRRDGRISPTGRMADVYPKAREGMQLVEDYAGQPMNPTQMDTVRKIIAEGMGSADANERRIGSMMTDEFDNFANPLAPEFPQARDIASRYLTAEKLEQARKLAGARAGQFTGSGFENALRTEYRGMDRGAIKGSQRFGEDVTGAIETVSRGTPGANFARAIGRFAPTGPVPVGVGAGMGGMIGGPAGAIVGGTIGALGTAGRMTATKMGIRNADVAELTARNGGKLPEPMVLTPDLQRLAAAYMAAESAKYLPKRQQ